MGWRDIYKVHPAADVFPMMSDEELDKLGEDIKKHGLQQAIVFSGHDGDREHPLLLDGRNRLEAAERAGIKLPIFERFYITSNPVAFIIGANIRRRHLDKQQQADLIVAAVKAGEKPRQVDEVSKGGRGRINTVKAKAVAEADKHGISKSTVERSLAKAEGKVPKPKRKVNSSALEIARGAANSAREAASVLREFEDTLEIDDDLLDACRKAANAWSKLLARQEEDNFEDDTFEPSEDVEEPAQVLTNVLDSIKDAKSVAEAYRKIFKVSSFDREAKKQIYDAINLLIAKWRTVQSTLSSRVS
jgi:ParB-like chromosome segregation protein Spo0J